MLDDLQRKNQIGSLVQDVEDVLFGKKVIGSWFHLVPKSSRPCVNSTIVESFNQDLKHFRNLVINVFVLNKFQFEHVPYFPYIIKTSSQEILIQIKLSEN